MENNSNANFVNIFACVFKGKALGTTLGILLWRGRGRGRGRQLFMGGGNLPTLLKAIFASLSRRCVYCHDMRGIC